MEKLFTKFIILLILFGTFKVLIFWCIEQMKESIRTNRSFIMRIKIKKIRNKFNKMLKGKKLSRDNISDIVRYLYSETRYKKNFNDEFPKAHYVYSCFKHCTTLEYKDLVWINEYLNNIGG